jgi:signal peptidase I
VLAVIAGLLVLVWIAATQLVAKAYQIPSEAMEPTLEVGDHVLADRHGIAGDPEPGDVVVFHPPVNALTSSSCPTPSRRGEACAQAGAQESNTVFVKRIVAGPGDQLSIEDGIPIVNGEPFEGDWKIRPCSGVRGCNFPEPITIPPDDYFMMGDNRGASDDSRYWGPVPRDWILGKVFFRYWPLDRLGGI